MIPCIRGAGDPSEAVVGDHATLGVELDSQVFLQPWQRQGFIADAAEEGTCGNVDLGPFTAGEVLGNYFRGWGVGIGWVELVAGKADMG